MSSACPALPIVAINWSMMPQGMLAYTCSACWQHFAFTIASITGATVELDVTSASSRQNTETSSDAELDRPPPTGTDVTMTASNDGSNSKISQLQTLWNHYFIYISRTKCGASYLQHVTLEYCVKMAQQQLQHLHSAKASQATEENVLGWFWIQDSTEMTLLAPAGERQTEILYIPYKQNWNWLK